MDLPSTIEDAVAKAVVQALASGVTEVIGKIPALFRRAGKAREHQRAAEAERARAELVAAAEDAPGPARLRQQALWEARIHDLLAEHPDALAELDEFLAAVRHTLGPAPAVKQQNINASAPGAFASGAIDGNVIHYHAGVPRPPSGGDEEQPG